MLIKITIFNKTNYLEIKELCFLFCILKGILIQFLLKTQAYMELTSKEIKLNKYKIFTFF